ncbi:MAG: hypothetical protein ACT4OT_02205 [Acidobacteriota bacterium]
MQNKISRVSLLLMFSLLQAILTQGQTTFPTEAPQLAQGRPVERTTQGGDVHRYQVLLSTGQYLNVVVAQRGVDVVVTAFGPGDIKIGEVDSPNGTQGLEPISIAASKPWPLETCLIIPLATARGSVTRDMQVEIPFSRM